MPFNETILKESLAQYKNSFPNRWESDKYKWASFKIFHDNWKPEATGADFAIMLKKSLNGAGKLLDSENRYPKKRIVELADEFPDEVREMFKNLFNEEQDFIDRIRDFKTESDNLLDRSTKSKEKHQQDENSITIYLWLNSPDEYYVYKFTEARNLSITLGCNNTYQFTKGQYDSNLKNFYAFYKELTAEICKDKELIALFNEYRERSEQEHSDHYNPDKNRITLTMDFGYYIASVLPKESTGDSASPDKTTESKRYWLYSPGDNATNWEEFYAEGIMAIGWNKIGDLRKFKSKKEIQAAIQKELSEGGSHKNSVLAAWEFSKVMRPGDVVFAKKGQKEIVGRGIVESDYEYDETREGYKNIRKVQWTYKGSLEYPEKAPVKVLTDITKFTGTINKLNEALRFVSKPPHGPGDDHEPELESETTIYESYSADEFLEDVYMTKEEYETLVELLEDKKNVILQGPPGVGKTYAAKRLAYSIIEEKNQDRVMMIQFHQSYSYEDFIMGLRPIELGKYELRRGSFYQFCKDAEEDDIDGEEEIKYFFIIDEINRGNISKIFGELFMLIESDKRRIPLQLLYSDEKFSIPKNVYIIGMMNTADRSLALLDYALRRRFSFYEMKPGFKTRQFQEYQDGLNSDKFNKLIACVMDLNAAIKDDESLGEGFSIGHSYFCNLKPAEVDKKLSRIIEHEIIPLLKEYWFDEPEKLEKWSEKLRSSIK